MTFKVVDHRLQFDKPFDAVELKQLNSRVSTIIRPRAIVYHYAVTSNLQSLIAAQYASGYWAHLSVDGFAQGIRGARYQVAQAMPFNQRGSHAGKSSWKRISSCNDFTIGLEIANPGPLIMGKDGRLRTTYGQVWDPDDADELPVPPGYPPGWTHWARYADQEIDLCVEISILLARTYQFEDVMGHSQISPGRKFDPGPAFPLQYLSDKVRASL